MHLYNTSIFRLVIVLVLYLVMIDSIISLQSSDFISFCQHSYVKTYNSKSCLDQETILVNLEFQDCICVNGIYYIEYHESCSYELIWSTQKTCFAPRSYDSKFLGKRDVSVKQIYGSFDGEAILAAIPSQFDEEMTLSLEIVSLYDGTFMVSGGYFLNVKLHWDNNTNSFCTVPTNDNGTVYVYSKDLTGNLFMTVYCEGEEITPEYIFEIYSPENSECTQDCYLQKQLFSQPISNQEPPTSLHMAQNLLNRLLIENSITQAFKPYRPYDLSKTYAPFNSFKILGRLTKLYHSLCSDSRVPKQFVENAVEMFGFMHDGNGYYHYEEYFSNETTKTIIKMLDHCAQDAEKVPLVLDQCSGDVTEIFERSTRRKVTLQNSDYPSERHHLILDITWNLIDLFNVACVESFSPSYRLYHDLEQGMEKLFTDELRDLWVYPDIPINFYARLLGLNWKTFARNMDMCVQGAYYMNQKMGRLLRPTWIFRKRRMNNKKLMLNNNEVICGTKVCTPAGSENFVQLVPPNAMTMDFTEY